jgi:hypothetical protein
MPATGLAPGLDPGLCVAGGGWPGQALTSKTALKSKNVWGAPYKRHPGLDTRANLEALVWVKSPGLLPCTCRPIGRLSRRHGLTLPRRSEPWSDKIHLFRNPQITHTSAIGPIKIQAISRRLSGAPKTFLVIVCHVIKLAACMAHPPTTAG